MLEFIKFELKYRFNRPATWIYFALMLLMSFLATSTDIVQAGGSGGKVMENAPLILAVIETFIMLFGVFIISAVMGVPVLRDFEHKTFSMIFTSPISKINYLGGKFLGSFIVTVIILSGVMWGAMIGQAFPWPWHDFTDKLNPFSFSVYWNPFAVFILPNLFIFSSIFFAGGALGKNMVVVYAQGIILFMGYLVASQFLSELDNQNTAALMDPFGMGAMSVTTQYWTVAEQNSLFFEWSGVILQNRLIWMAVGLITLLFTFWKFSFSVSGKSSKSSKKISLKDEVAADIAIPSVHQQFGLGAQLLQIRSLSWFYFRWIIKQGPFLFITLAGIIFVFVIAFVSGTSGYDIELYMTSSRTLSLINVFGLFFVIIIVFYSGEIVWKERDIKINLIYDALPYPNYVILFSKFLGMVFMSLMLLTVLMFCGVLIQIIKGYPEIEWLVYFNGLYLDTFLMLALYLILSLFIQATVNQKFLGFGLVFLFWVSRIVMGELGIEHAMFYFARTSLGNYSEMNQYGHYVEPFSWFNIYWFGFAGILYAIAILFSVRGLDTQIVTRLKLSRMRLNKVATFSIAAAIIVFLTSGGFIYYNTNVLNDYQNSDDSKADRAKYERTLKQYEWVTQPKIIDTYVEVELYPGERDFKAKGYYLLKNKSDSAISTLHIQKSVDSQLNTDLSFDRDVEVQEDFSDFKYTIYRLNEALAPGDTLQMNFDISFNTVGFKEGGSNTDVVFNGTFFNNSSYFPGIGYNSGFELGSDDDRKENDLEPKERMMERDDPRGIAQSLFGDDADKITFEIKVTTDSSQIAVAPGYLQSKSTEGDRTTYHYKMDVPMVNFYSIISAEYTVVKDKWQPPVDTLPEVNLEIYYHKGHEYNLDRMMNGMKEALTYYTESFGPFQFRQLRILEFPRYRGFAQSFANTVPFSEGIGFIQNIKTKDVDLPFYVTAHEVAHQWWGHQVTEAGVRGNAMLSETLSQYSALMVMKKNYEPEIIKEFLRHELNSYLTGRTFEQKKEMPLEKVEGQGYIHYRKGSLVMYALQDYIGEDSVNAALKRFLGDFAFKDAPYPTSADLLRYYREVTPDSLQYIIDDMFVNITLFENKTTEAVYEVLPDSTYKVSLTMDVIKYQADSLGSETSIALNDWIDVGVFIEDEDGEEKLIYLQKHKITEQSNTIELIVNQKPAKAGIDPINKLIDRNPRDNVKEVSEKEDTEEVSD